MSEQIEPVAGTGSGSYQEIVAYITAVIEQRTTVNPDTTAEKLARGITASVLHRLHDTSHLTVRADELYDERLRGYREAQEKYGQVGSLRDAVDECLNLLALAVDQLRGESNHA